MGRSGYPPPWWQITQLGGALCGQQSERDERHTYKKHSMDLSTIYNLHQIPKFMNPLTHGEKFVLSQRPHGPAPHIQPYVIGVDMSLKVICVESGIGSIKLVDDSGTYYSCQTGNRKLVWDRCGGWRHCSQLLTGRNMHKYRNLLLQPLPLRIYTHIQSSRKNKKQNWNW